MIMGISLWLVIGMNTTNRTMIDMSQGARHLESVRSQKRAVIEKLLGYGINNSVVLYLCYLSKLFLQVWLQRKIFKNR